MDLRLYATILDHLLKKRYKELGDLVAQQLKATEQALEDKGSWERAKYISLLEEEDRLVTREDRNVMTAEYKWQAKVKGKGGNQWNSKGWSQDQGKGNWGGPRPNNPFEPNNNRANVGSAPGPKGYQKGGKGKAKSKWD